MFEIRFDQVPDDRMLFTGDCIFQGGVGMFFEGTANMMHSIIKELKKNVSPETKLFYGHNYGWKNLLWAKEFLNGLRESYFYSQTIRSMPEPVMARFKELIEKVSNASAEVNKKKLKGIASTGVSLQEESDCSLFLAAVGPDDSERGLMAEILQHILLKNTSRAIRKSDELYEREETEAITYMRTAKTHFDQHFRAN
jgi:hypothetical protein